MAMTKTDQDIAAFHAGAAGFWQGQPCPLDGAARNGWIASAVEAQRQVVADRAYLTHRTDVVEALHQAGAGLRVARLKKLTPRERELISNALALIQAVLPHCGPDATSRRVPSSRGGGRDVEA